MQELRLMAIVLLLLAPAPACSRSDSSVPSGKSSFSLPFGLVDNRVFIDVKLNGRGPFRFILDTGAGGALLNTGAANHLGLRVEDAGEEGGVGEQKEHFGRTRIEQVQIGDMQLNDLEFAVSLTGGAPHVFGTAPFDGVIGLEVFQRMVVKHDYMHRMLTFTVPEKFSYTGSGTIVHFERPRQIPVVAAELDGVAGTFGVDTGARSSLLLYVPFVKQNKLKEKYAAKVDGVTGWGLGGPVRSLLARARELKIGDLSVHDLVVRLSTQKAGATTSSAMAGLIGPDVLSQFDVTFDYSRSRIILEKNQDYGRHDSYDRSGMWMGQDGKQFTVIDVIAGGPAEAAGIKQGETILAINGESTDNLVLPDAREGMRLKPPGTNVTFLMEAAGKQRTAVVTLRDLV